MLFKFLRLFSHNIKIVLLSEDALHFSDSENISYLFISVIFISKEYACLQYDFHFLNILTKYCLNCTFFFSYFVRIPSDNCFGLYSWFTRCVFLIITRSVPVISIPQWVKVQYKPCLFVLRSWVNQLFGSPWWERGWIGLWEPKEWDALGLVLSTRGGRGQAEENKTKES